MTREQQRCLDGIAALTVGAVSPTYRELADHLGLRTTSGAHRLVVALRQEGLVTLTRGRARSIRILADSPAYTPAALCELSAESLRRLIATASGVLAHKDGGARTDQTLKRIGDRLVGRQRVRA